MKRLKVLALLMVLVLMGSILSIQTNAKTPKVKDLPVQDLFTGFEGTTVIKNLKTDTVYIYNQNRSRERFTPESTFKVPNALIGLETKHSSGSKAKEITLKCLVKLNILKNHEF